MRVEDRQCCDVGGVRPKLAGLLLGLFRVVQGDRSLGVWGTSSTGDGKIRYEMTGESL